MNAPAPKLQLIQSEPYKGLVPKPCPPSCALYADGQGFVRPEGKGTLGVLILGEAGGATERREGLPFRPQAQAGSLLERVIKGCGYDRQMFRIANIVNCQPPRDWLDGAPWELEAIACCRPHRDGIVHSMQPRSILALGAVATRVLTGLTGEKRGISYLRGYALPAIDYNDIPVVPSFHPAFIRRGKGELQGVLAYDVQKAIELAQGKGDAILRPSHADMPGFILHPSLDDARSYLLKVRDNQGAVLAYDIETPRSSGVNEDEVEDEVGNEAQIIQIQFSIAVGDAICLPWSDGYIDIARELLALPVAKAGHNCWRFDNPRLHGAGAPALGTVHDTMQLWRHLQPDLPANLQFVASFYGMPFPWKHYSGTDEAFYGCCDVDAVSRIMAAALEQLRRMGIENGYMRHRVGLEPVLVNMSRRGIPVDDEERQRLRAEFERQRLAVDAEIQQLVPPSLLNPHPKEGYKKTPKDTTGMVERVFAATPGTEGAFADDAGGYSIVRWCKLLPFKASNQQLIRYMKSRGHKVPLDLKKGTETSAAKELERLAKQTADPLYRKVIEYRNLQNMVSTFVDGWEPDAAGRVHPSYYTETGTGQLNSKRPNGQNFPKHGALAKQMRRMIQARAGHRLVELDYTAFHAMTTGFEARDAGYMRAARLDIHSLVSGHVLKLHDAHALLEKSDAELRDYFKWYKSDAERKFHRDKKAKPSILGIGFGLGVRKLYDMNREAFANQREAQELRNVVQELFPKVFGWQNEVRGLAHRQTFLRSRYGYIRHFFDVYHWDSGKGCLVSGEDSEAAIAFLPANDAFGRIKETMLWLEEQGLNERYGLCNQIHDALVFECPEPLLDECLHMVKAEMEKPSEVLIDAEVAPQGLAVAAEASVGQSWDAMQTVEVR